MLIACECLNIVMRLEDSATAVTESLNIKMKSRCNNFAQVLYKSIPYDTEIKLPKLVNIRHYGGIKIHRCLYCGNDLYGSYDNSSEIIFEKGWVMLPDDLNAKQINPKFSPFFKILIDHAELDPDYKFDDGYEEKLSSEARLWLEDQAALTERKIEVYTNEQFANLEVLKKRVCQDNDIIAKKLLSLNPEREIMSGKRMSIRDDASVNEVPPVVIQQNEKNIDYPVYESDEVFFLDDVDTIRSSADYYVDMLPEEPDIQNRITENEYISNAALMSRSLPLAVPQFISDKDIDRPVSPDVPVDIAASIKALARSLHGDKIFGDLPPPRFSAL